MILISSERKINAALIQFPTHCKALHMPAEGTTQQFRRNTSVPLYFLSGYGPKILSTSGFIYK
jgi:hypothetical protein